MNGELLMEKSADPVPGQRIDLMRETDVAYWCRVFDVSIDQLREAIRHAGPQAAQVRRYLVLHPPAPR